MPLNKFIILAFLFTTLNAICGVVGVIVTIYSSSVFPFLAMQLLIFGAIFDYLDGKIAKKSETKSALGEYFDSVADVITFAVLPGIMVLNAPVIGNEIDLLGELIALSVAILYSLCGWIRLARFATNPTHIHFEGLPSPAAALLVGSSAVLATLPEMTWLFWSNGIPLAFITVIAGILMILTIKYPTPKRGKKPDMIAISIAGVVVLIFVFSNSPLTLSIVLFIAILYTTLGPLYLKET